LLRSGAWRPGCREARINCERAYETDRVVFAIRDDIRVQYEIASNSQILGNYAGGGPCSHVQGSMQNQANREAIKRCGGADECLLLYAGTTKTANIDIVAQ